MKQKPRWTLEMLIAALAVLCALLTLGHRHLRFPVSAAALDRQVGGWRQL